MLPSLLSSISWFSSPIFQTRLRLFRASLGGCTVQDQQNTITAVSIVATKKCVVFARLAERGTDYSQPVRPEQFVSARSDKEHLEFVMSFAKGQR